ncbi:MAG: hypothetical protein SF070_04180 [Gemmatimonadota bacterium]|nr:hypothetical protein [Gemmatimonadota bacterium]
MLVTAPSPSARSRLPLARQPAVQLVGNDGRGTARPGVPITASLSSGGGSLLGTLVVPTDEDGRATFADLAIGGRVGSHRLQFAAPGLDPIASDAIVLLGGAPASLTVIGGTLSGVPAGSLTPITPTFLVRDADQNSVSSQLVEFTLLNGGSIGQPQAASDAQGIASPGSWTVGGTVGAQQLAARVFSAPHLVATALATVVHGPPAGVIILAGNNQTVTAGSPAPIRPSVRLVDRFGNPIAGTTLVFSPTNSQAGTVTGATQVTDAEGVATLGGWTLGTVAGGALLHVYAGTGPPDFYGSLSALVTAGPAAAIRLVGGAVDTIYAPAGQPLTPLEFEVSDQYGNLIGGAPVGFLPSHGTVDSLSATTSASGRATPGAWHLGATIGPQHLAVSSSAAQFTQTAFAHAGRILAKVAGDSQPVEVGTPVPVAPTVRVTDSLGTPVEGIPISFTVGANSGSYAGPAVVRTDAAGEARAPGWTVGTVRTAGSSLRASSRGLAGDPADFQAVLQAGPPVDWAYAFGPTTGTVNEITPEPPIVGIADRYGNRVPSQRLEWTITAGGGTLVQADSMTNSLGDGAAVWRLGTRAGLNRLILKTPSLPGDSIRYETLGLPGPADTVLAVSGDGQSAAVRRALPVSPVVLVTDQFGNPVPNVVVVFTVVSGGGTLSAGGSRLTDGGGQASPGVWTLGPTRGAQTLRARVGNPFGPQPEVLFTATAVQPAAASLVAIGGSGQTVRAGAPSPMPVAVRILDSLGFGIEGDTVRFAVSGGSGSLPAPYALTDTGGIARLYGWALGPGANSLTASHGTLAGQTAQFSATGVATTSSWDIALLPVAPLSQPVQAAFDSAVVRWRALIVGDVPDVSVSLPADSCFTGQPAFTGTVDDLLIFVLVVPIDGAGGILGGTGICALRTVTALPSVAAVILDAADLQAYASFLPAIVLHEVGHAVGIGSLWAGRALVANAGTTAPRYVGTGGKLGYWALRGATGTPATTVPVEGNQSPTGSRDVHWEESTFDTELMTPYLDGALEPLSLMTAAALSDLGYSVDLAAADGSFTLLRAGPAPGPRLAPGWELLFPGPIPPGVIPVAPIGP